MSTLNIRYVHHKDELLLLLSQPVDMLTLTAEQSRAMAAEQLRFADAAEKPKDN